MKKRTIKHFYFTLLTFVLLIAGSASRTLSVCASQGGREGAAALAYTQINQTNGTKYGASSGEAWCAYFAGWCARNGGGIGTTDWPNVGSTTILVDKFKKMGRWHDKCNTSWSYYKSGYGEINGGGKYDGYTPQPGDFVAIDNNGSVGDGPDHTGIVYSVVGNTLTTIEGNISKKVVKVTYNLSTLRPTSGNVSSSTVIVGFGEPNYKPVNQSPKLTVDSIQANGDGTIRVRGWAFDPDDSSASITIHTYIGGDSGTPGAEGWQFIADLESVDVNNAYGINGKHRFDATIKTAKRGGNSVVVYALDTNQGTNVWYSPYSVNITNTNDIDIVSSISMDEGKTKTISFSFKGDGIHQLAYGIHDSTIISASWGDTYWDKTQSNITVNGLKEGKTILDICFLDSNGKEFYKESITITVNHVHKYTIEKVVKKATCSATGLTKYYCSCGAVSSKTTTIAKKSHTYVTDAAVEATCMQTGKTEGKHCSVCGYVLTAQEIIPTKEHNYVTDVAVEATCTQTGKTEGKHCSVCEYVLTAQEIIPAKEHNYVTDVAVEATCTQTGKTEGRHCSICEYVDVPQTIIPVKDHILDEGIIIKQPTKSECGERQSTCKVCKQKFLISIPIINAGDTNDSGSDETNNGNQNSDETNNGNQNSDETNNGNQSPDETTQNNTIDQEVSKEDNSDGLDDEENIDDEKITMPPSVGTITTYSGMKYKVIKNGKDCYVQCLGPVSKNVTKATIKSYIYIGSYRYPVCQIKSDAFKNCKKLTKVVIGDNVKTIGKNVFYGCKKLKSITIQSKKLSVVKKNAFKGIYKKAKIKVPKSKRTKYKKLLKKAGVKSTAVIK